MSRRDDRLTEELQFHLEQQIAKNVRKGMTPEEARRDALVRFGGVEPAREAARDQLRGAWLSDLGRDMRVALRSLARVPSFSLSAVLTFGLGVAAAAAMFSVIRGVLLEPLPYPDSDRIVQVFQLSAQGGRNRVSDPNYEDWRTGTTAFKAMAQFSEWGPVPVSGAHEAQIARMTRVSREFFDAMGVYPVIGRGFQPDEQQPGGPAVAIVSEPFWRAWRPSGIPNGEVIRIGTESFTVIGVMPAGFDFPRQTSIWTPREVVAQSVERTAHNSLVVARLADGVTLEHARSQVSALSKRLKLVHRDRTWMEDGDVASLLEVTTLTTRPALILLFVASIALLVVATTNLSNLVVVRNSSRRAEFAMQIALGATSGRLGRQLMAESLVLCLAGGALGIAGAALAVRLFVAAGPSTVARLDSVTVSWTSALFAIAVSTLAALTLNLVSVVGARSTRVSAAIADQGRSGGGGRRQARVREALIVAQVALTLVLLSGAALLARSLASVMAVDPGYSLDDGLVVEVTTPSDGTPDALARQVSFQDAVLEDLRRQPGVDHVGLVSSFPIGFSGRNGTFIEMTRVDEITSFAGVDRSRFKDRSGSAQYRHVSGDYFAALGIPLLDGRLIDDRDTPSAPHVAVVSKTLADTQWPGRSAVGRFIQFGNMDGDLRGIRVIGVVGDVREFSPEVSPSAMIYVSARQRPRQASRAWVVIKGPAAVSMPDAVRRIVKGLNPDVPATITTISSALDRVLSSRRFTMWLVTAFGAAALLLAVLGVYGLMSYIVSQRTREMGIRMALGAEPRSLVWLVVRRGLVLAVIGAVAGVAVSRLAAGLLDGLLFEVDPGDPITIAAAVLTLLVAAALATWLPASRILKQTPGRTLRDV